VTKYGETKKGKLKEKLKILELRTPTTQNSRWSRKLPTSPLDPQMQKGELGRKERKL
jgi:hypothetical protein